MSNAAPIPITRTAGADLASGWLVITGTSDSTSAADDTTGLPLLLLTVDSGGLTAQALDVLDHILSRRRVQRRGPWRRHPDIGTYWIAPVEALVVPAGHPRHTESDIECRTEGACAHTTLAGVSESVLPSFRHSRARAEPLRPEVCKRGHLYAEVGMHTNANGRRECNGCRPIWDAARHERTRRRRRAARAARAASPTC